jgi:hypothetical protein
VAALPRRLAVALAVLGLAGPLALVAAGADALPATRCAQAGAVSRTGDWEAVRGPAFTTRPGGRGQAVTTYAVHPVRPQVRFATNGTSVERTDDGGCTWREVYALPDVPSEEDTLAVATAEVQELVVPADPRGADRLVLVLRDGNGGPRVMASEDGGREEPFRDRSEGLPPSGRPRDLHIAPTNPDFLFLGIETVAEEQGPDDPDDALPLPVPTLPPLPGVPADPAPSAATSPGALYGSVDGGLTWEARVDLADLGGSTSGIDLLSGHPTSPNRLWAVSDGVLRSSTDGGRTFKGPGPTPAEQRARSWRVTAVTTQLLPTRPGSPGQTLVYAFSATSAQGSGPVVLLSSDDGKTYDETRAPGVVDAAAAFLPGSGTVVVSTRAQGGRPAGVHVLEPGRDGVRSESIGPPADAPSFAVSADNSDRPTFHARTSAGLLRYVGPAAALPPELPPLVGGAIADTLPPLGAARLTPARDEVRLQVGQRRTVSHALVPPRRPSSLDLFLLVDTSISMADDLDRVSADLVAMVERLEAEGVDVSVGLGEFKGGESTVAYRRVTGVGPGVGPLRAGLGELVADGFGLEAQLIAMEQALEGRGETPDALLTAPCKFTAANPDRFVQEERRSAPPVLPGQQADFRSGAVPVVLMVTDTNFLRPSGTRLKRDCTVDVTSVAQRYAAAGVHAVGLGVDDVDNPQRAADLLELARTTGALQPAGTRCAPGIDPAPGGAAVCRSAVDLVPTLESLATRPTEPLVLTTTETGAGQVLTVPARLEVDLRRAEPVDLPVTYACDEAGTFDAGVEVRMAGAAVASLTSRVVCERTDLPEIALPPAPAAAAAVAVAGVLPPPAPVPPPAPPAQAAQAQAQTQPQSQTQAQAQSGTQEEQQRAVQLALALQGLAQDEGTTVQAMSAREVPDVVRLTALALMTAAAGGLAVRRRNALRALPVRAPITRR